MHIWKSLMRNGIAALAAAGVVMLCPGVAAADATDDYPIPNRMLKTTCTAEQIMAAARDVRPVYYEQMAFRWPNWAKLFFNNKGVAARTTDVCAQYPPDDMSVWTW